MRILRLEDYGPFVALKFRGYEKALADHRKAKAAKKRAETEEKEEQFFYVDDRIMQPYLLATALLFQSFTSGAKRSKTSGHTVA
ncbi:hypothetical protein BMI79_03070 [Serratia oryzae]|uniref:Uncharacterized protein n=1 Tax=Serratia oryzae TaxID=2034155 RepID=A0A1S8CR14_9GAMM|nr:hypothetical protein BMI79_03070 [Serratia oryzae]